MSNPQGVDAQVARMVSQLMVKYGVAGVKNALGRVGSLAQHDGHVVHFGLNISWLPWQEHQKLWASAGLPGQPAPIQKDEEGFYKELIQELNKHGIGRATWSDDTLLMFVRDSSAPNGLAFKLRELNLIPIEQEPKGFDLHF